MSRPSPLSARTRSAAAYDFDVITDAPEARAIPPQMPDRADAPPEPVKPEATEPSRERTS